jgi:hypothetical protein
MIVDNSSDSSFSNDSESMNYDILENNILDISNFQESQEPFERLLSEASDQENFEGSDFYQSSDESSIGMILIFFICL